MQVMSIYCERASGMNRLLFSIAMACIALLLFVAHPNSAAAKQGNATANKAGTSYTKVATHYGRRKRRRVRRKYAPYSPYYGQVRYKRKKRRARRKVRRTRVKPVATVWKSDESLSGPVQIVISLPRQSITVYKAGKQVARSRISTGRPGYGTPTGVFSIIQKRRYHYSNLYGGAPMPFMQRITWSGIALHAGVVPGYPASHGCIRLPGGFASKLFRYTKMGAHVIITRDATAPADINHPQLFQPNTLAEIVAAAEPTNAVELHARQDGEDGELARSQIDASTWPTIAAAALQMADFEALQERVQAFQKRSKLPLRILITRRSGRERVKDVQRVLADLGYGPGPADGQAGRATISAIKRFQESIGLPKSGAITDTLVAELYQAAGRGAPSTGHIYVRQDFREIYEAPVVIKDPSRRLGTHLYTAMNFGKAATSVRWQAMSMSDRGPRKASFELSSDQTHVPAGLLTASRALDRIELPNHVKQRIADMLTSGSSLVITDNGISRETGRGTDFVVLTR